MTQRFIDDEAPDGHDSLEGQRSSKGRIARSAGLVGAATLASRVLGMLRDIVIAASFTKGSTDAFFVAFTIPNVLRRLLAEGALAVAFIPVFSEWRARSGDDGARSVLANTLGPALVLLVLVCSVGAAFAPALVRLFAYGLSREPEKFATAVTLTRAMFPYLLMVGLLALAMGALNAYNHFLAPAAAPALFNAVMIAVTSMAPGWLISVGVSPVYALAAGVLLGGALQVVLQLPPLARRSLLVAPRFDLRHAGVRRVGHLMLPSIAGLAIYQVNVIFSRQFASFLQEGAISYIYYAQRFIEFPIGIFATAMATVTMPQMSVHASTGRVADLKATYGFALRLVLFVMLPATAGLIALAEPLIAVLFQRGAFSAQMAQETAWTLVGFCLGLCGAGGVRQTVPVFYAMQDVRTPVKVSALALAVYVVAALATYRSWGTFGLAFAVSLAATVNFVTLLVLLRRRLGPIGARAIAGSAARAALAASVCGVVAWSVARAGRWEAGGGLWRNYVVLLAAVLAGTLTFLFASVLLGAREPGELRQAFGSRSGSRSR